MSQAHLPVPLTSRQRPAPRIDWGDAAGSPMQAPVPALPAPQAAHPVQESWLQGMIDKSKPGPDEAAQGGQAVVAVTSPWEAARAQAAQALMLVARDRDGDAGGNARGPQARQALAVLPQRIPGVLPIPYTPSTPPPQPTLRDQATAILPETMMMVRLAAVAAFAVAATLGARALSDSYGDQRAAQEAELARQTAMTQAYNASIRAEQERTGLYYKSFVKYRP